MSPLRATPSRSRAARAVAALGVAAATLGLSGCQWTSPITTQMSYDAADGTSVTVGEVQVVNALIVAKDANGPGTLVGSLDNRGRQATSLAISVAGAPVARVEIPAGSVVKLSDAQAGKFTTVPKVPTIPGGLAEVSFGDAKARVPVLAPHSPYEKYAPGGAPASTTSSPSTTGAPSATEGTGH